MMPKLLSSLLLAVSLPVAAGSVEGERLFLADSSAPVSIRVDAGSSSDDPHTLYVGALNRNGVMVDDWRPVSEPHLTLNFRGEELVFMLHDKRSSKIRFSSNLPHSPPNDDDLLRASVTHGDGNAIVSFVRPDGSQEHFTIAMNNVSNVSPPESTVSDPGAWAILLGCLGMVSVVAHRRNSKETA